MKVDPGILTNKSSKIPLNTVDTDCCKWSQKFKKKHSYQGRRLWTWAAIVDQFMKRITLIFFLTVVGKFIFTTKGFQNQCRRFADETIYISLPMYLLPITFTFSGRKHVSFTYSSTYITGSYFWGMQISKYEGAVSVNN